MHVSASLYMSLQVSACACACVQHVFASRPLDFIAGSSKGALSARSNRYVNMRVHFAPPRRLAGVDCINLEANTPKNNHNNITRRQRQQQAAVHCAVGCAVLWHATCFYINQLLAKHDAGAHAIDLWGGVQRGSHCSAPFKAHFKLLGKLH